MDKNIRYGKEAVAKESRSIRILEKKFSEKEFARTFSAAVNEIFKCKGKVIVTGLGKSGIIAQKISATLNSTGTYSMFLHTADSIHGDLGTIRKEDIVMIISKSGDTPEILKIIPFFKRYGVKTILITGDKDSTIAHFCEYILDCDVEEACPHNLAPTSSSTVALVTGDAIAIALLQKRGFSKKDFALFHPGGVLGRKLLLRVDDIMVKGSDLPIVNLNTNLKEVIYLISSKRLGCAIVLNKKNIAGMVTDGDLRRLLEKRMDIENLKAKDAMSENPKMIPSSSLAVNALNVMEKNKITQLIISNDGKTPAGIIHIHTLVELGLK